MYMRRLLFVFTWIQFAVSLENFALGKTTTMSTSQYTDKWLASAAVDGNTDQTLEGNSCAVTSDDNKPEAWWKVDLVVISNIEQVKIYYRDENDGIHDPTTVTTMRLPTSTVQDEHVGQQRANFALHKTAIMSTSQFPDKWLAGAAIDGNTNQTLDWNSCAVTSDNYKPEAWWKVDLGSMYSIHEVKIYNRDENDGNSYTYRLSGFYIYVSNDSVSLGSSCYVNNNGNQANPGPNSITSFPCVVTGRYVTIYKSKKESCKIPIINKNTCVQLELCEVEVLGYVYKDNCPKNCLNEICDSDHRCFDCEDGYTGTFCNVLCEQGKFGRNCSQMCDSACQKGSCHYGTGKCATNCVPGRKGRYCDEACGYKEYGIDCLRTCDNCLDGGCSADTGICLNGCIDGWTGPSCSSPTGNQLIAVVVVLSVGLAIVIAINVLMIIKPGLLPCRRGNNNSKNQNRSGTYVQSTSHGTTETYENPNMSVISDLESTHTYTPLQIRGQLH